MRIYFSEKGLTPVIVILIIAALGLGGVGTAAAANNSKPGDPLFGLDTALEQIQINLASDDISKAKVGLEIAGERLDELNTLEETGGEVDVAALGVQTAVDNATSNVNNVQTKFKENKITISSTDLQALLTELQNILTTHQGLIRRVEIKIKDGEIRAQIKLFEKEASKSAVQVKEDLRDIEDDGELNDSNEEDEEDEDEESTRSGKRSSQNRNNNEDDEKFSSSRSGTSGNRRDGDED